MASWHFVRELAAWLIVASLIGTGGFGIVLTTHPRFQPHGRHRATGTTDPGQPSGGEAMERIAPGEPGEWVPSGLLTRWAGKLSEFRLISIGGPRQ